MLGIVDLLVLSGESLDTDLALLSGIQSSFGAMSSGLVGLVGLLEGPRSMGDLHFVNHLIDFDNCNTSEHYDMRSEHVPMF